MSTSFSNAREDKENQYHHDVRISPEKKRQNGSNNLRWNCNHNGPRMNQEDDIISPTLLKTRKQLVELWLNPVCTLDTSLEQIVEDDSPPY